MRTPGSKPRRGALAPLSWWTRLGLLPLPERCFVALLLASAVAPAAAVTYADYLDPSGLTAFGAVGQHPLALAAVALLVSFAALLLLEVPRSLSPRAYAAQLRLRLSQSQSHYDAALRRRLEESNNANH